MVCIRCKMVVKDELTKLSLHYTTVELGESDILENISALQRHQLKVALLKSGLELIHYSEEPLTINFSDYLSQQLQFDYTYLANLFSEVQGTTIEHFMIAHKIERVKEMLVYDELNLTEIAYQMHYSSVAHLSAQFKKVTGLTPSYFKKIRIKRRTMLEDV